MTRCGFDRLAHDCQAGVISLALRTNYIWSPRWCHLAASHYDEFHWWLCDVKIWYALVVPFVPVEFHHISRYEWISRDIWNRMENESAHITCEMKICHRTLWLQLLSFHFSNVPFSAVVIPTFDQFVHIHRCGTCAPARISSHVQPTSSEEIFLCSSIRTVRAAIRVQVVQ